MFREAGKLASTILAHVDQLLDASLAKQREKFLCCFARETDGAKKTLHGA
jgi:hypothetical protein